MLDPYFDCPNCKSRVRRLVYSPGGSGCDACVEMKDQSAKGMLHLSANNKFYQGKMTMADKLHITTRDTHRDGVNRPHWRWR